MQSLKVFTHIGTSLAARKVPHFKTCAYRLQAFAVEVLKHGFSVSRVISKSIERLQTNDQTYVVFDMT
jgi:hypothetical protein